MAGIVVPALLIVLPLFWFYLGFGLAVAHAVLGFAGAFVVLEVLLLSYEKVPFACTYLPSESLKTFAIPYVVIFLTGASAFARMERTALDNPGATVRLLLFLATIVVIVRIAAGRRASRPPIDFDEAPTTTQRLGLHT
jgi:hypothetical protein